MGKITYVLMMLIFLTGNICLSQNLSRGVNKVDSVFKNYLCFLDTVNLSENVTNEELNCNWEKRDIIIVFLENITGIYLKREPGISGHGICKVEETGDLKKWEDWFLANKNDLVWVDDTNKIDITDASFYTCIKPYEFYPFKIRFRTEPTKIPNSFISTKPENSKDKSEIIPSSHSTSSDM